MAPVSASGPPAIISLSGLGTLGASLSTNNGESLRVCRVPSFPGWIYKEYRVPPSPADVQRLDKLIALPSAMNIADRALVTTHTSWPGSRVTDGSRSVGVLIPLAPDSYRAELQTRPGKTISKMLEIDMLAQPPKQHEKLKLPSQSLADRMMACAMLARIGALFERHGIVYLDWSYANVFWSASDKSVYVIDMDGCSFAPRAQMETPNWTDPLVPRGKIAGNESDRYRLALLIGRCLTAERGDPAATRSALNRLRLRSGATEREVLDLLVRTLSAEQVGERPSVTTVSAALDAATGVAPSAGSVTGWRRVGRGSRPSAAPRASSGTTSASGSASTGTRTLRNGASTFAGTFGPLTITPQPTTSAVPPTSATSPAPATVASSLRTSYQGTSSRKPAKRSSAATTVFSWIVVLLIIAAVIFLVAH